MFNNTGGTVNISSGTLDNPGKTTPLNSTTGSWTMGGAHERPHVGRDGMELLVAANINNLLTGRDRSMAT